MTLTVGVPLGRKSQRPSCPGWFRQQALALLWQIAAVWASLRWRSKNEIDDGVAYGRRAWLRRRSVDSFFSAPLARGDGVARKRRRSWSSARDDEDLARSPLKVIKPEL